MAEAPLMKSRQKCLCSTIKLVKERRGKCEMKISFAPGPLAIQEIRNKPVEGFAKMTNVQAADVQANVQAAKLSTFPQHVLPVLDNR